MDRVELFPNSALAAGAFFELLGSTPPMFFKFEPAVARSLYIRYHV